MRENALELHGVCKKYGGFALRNVGFTLPRGRVNPTLRSAMWDLPCREAR